MKWTPPMTVSSQAGCLMYNITHNIWIGYTRVYDSTPNNAGCYRWIDDRIGHAVVCINIHTHKELVHLLRPLREKYNYSKSWKLVEVDFRHVQRKGIETILASKIIWAARVHMVRPHLSTEYDFKVCGQECSPGLKRSKSEFRTRRKVSSFSLEPAMVFQ